jgi:hypothetical protein
VGFRGILWSMYLMRKNKNKRIGGYLMENVFDIRGLIKAREAHGKEVENLELSIKNAINGVITGMKITYVHLGENKDNSFNFTVWGKLDVA